MAESASKLKGDGVRSCGIVRDSWANGISMLSKPLLFGVALANMIRAMVGAYGLSVTLFIIARVLIGERWVVIALFNNFSEWLWMPAVLLLPVMLLLRAWRMALLLVAPVVAFSIIFGAQFVPNPVTAAQEGATITVMSYNRLASNRNRDAIVNLIRNVDAELVALQEVDEWLVDVIETHLQDAYPHLALHVGAKATHGQGILSRYPILEDEFWQYDWLPHALGHQRSVIDVAGTPIVLYNVHTTHPGSTGVLYNDAYRSREVDDLVTRASAEAERVLLLGDFNLTPPSDDYQQLTAQFTDSFAAVGRGMGWTYRLVPGWPANIRIDYIFHDAGWQALDAHVWTQPTGSDHRPLIAQFAIIPR